MQVLKMKVKIWNELTYISLLFALYRENRGRQTLTSSLHLDGVSAGFKFHHFLKQNQEPFYFCILSRAIISFAVPVDVFMNGTLFCRDHYFRPIKFCMSLGDPMGISTTNRDRNDINPSPVISVSKSRIKIAEVTGGYCMPHKVRRCYSVNFLNWRPIFDWCVVRWASKNKHHKHTCSKEIGLHLQILLSIPHSIVNTLERTYVFNLGINRRALLITITKSGEVQFFHLIFADAPL